jgi:hypothetical protein
VQMIIVGAPIFRPCRRGSPSGVGYREPRSNFQLLVDAPSAFTCTITPRPGCDVHRLIIPPSVAPPGVSRVDNKFRVVLYLPGCERKSLGWFRDEVEAALVYDAAAREHGLPTHKLNFPNGPPAKRDNPSGRLCDDESVDSG